MVPKQLVGSQRKHRFYYLKIEIFEFKCKSMHLKDFLNPMRNTYFLNRIEDYCLILGIPVMLQNKLFLCFVF